MSLLMSNTTLLVGLFLVTFLLLILLDASGYLDPDLSRRHSQACGYTNSIPWVGLRPQWFARLRAKFRSLDDSQAMLIAGYAEHSKNNRPFVLPQLSSPPLVVLPASRTKELAVLAEDEFDIESLNRELAAADYTSKLDYGDTRHMNVVGRQLTISRHLPELIPIIFDELVTSMQHRWKPATSMEDQQWTVAEIYPTSMQLVAQVIARVFSGERLGRTPGFADAVIRHTEAVFTAGALIGLIPTLLRPVLAPLLMLVCGIPGLYGAVKSIALPVIKERMTAVSGSGDANSAALPADKPADMLQWLVEDCMHAADGNNHFRLDDDAMVTRLLHLHMAAIHTTSITVANVIINLYGAGRDHFVGGLQEEVERVLSEHGAEWDMGAINSLHRIDSAIRESMRYTPMSDISLRRVISSRRGVDLSEGLHLPCGTRVVVPAFCIQRDQDIFGMDAGSYDAFRFSRPLEQRTNAASEAESKLPHPKPQAITSTSESFTAFGHGRHACPGRFFASTLMKLMIAHIVTNYDVQIVDGSRFPSKNFGSFHYPSHKTAFRVRPLQRKV